MRSGIDHGDLGSRFPAEGFGENIQDFVAAPRLSRSRAEALERMQVDLVGRLTRASLYRSEATIGSTLVFTNSVRHRKEGEMSEAIERVAKAIAEALGHTEGVDDHHRRLARAAIAAMAEPPAPEPRPVIFPAEWLEN
jgi:hypothetical protein